MTSNSPAYIARDIPDLLDVLPALFGFAPKESFIAIATEGERARLGFRLRMDIPPLPQVPAAAAQIASYLRRQHPDGAILIALTDDADNAAVADALMVACLAELHDIVVHEAVRASAESYWRYQAGRPGDPVPYRHRCSAAVVDAVVSGRPIFGEREALVAKFAAVSGTRKELMATATDRALRVAGAELAGRQGDELGAVGMRLLAPIIDRFGPGSTLSDAELATLAVWVSLKAVRDEVWSAMDRAGADTTFALWTEVAQSVVAPFEPPVLCLCAFAAWLTGDGTQALIAVERALQIQPDYSLAGLIVQLIQSAMPPQEWEGFSPQAGPTS